MTSLLNNKNTQSDNWILYDGDCPFCQNYMRFTYLKESVGPIRLIDAREHTKEFEEVNNLGYNLDEGMILKYHGQYFHGDECLNRLALMSSGHGIINKICATLFRSPLISKISYPLLKTGRAMTLFLLGREKIHKDHS